MDEKDDSELLTDAATMGIKLWKKIVALAKENNVLKQQAEKLREELVAAPAKPKLAPEPPAAVSAVPPVDPGDGWRLLEVGETIQDGDYRNSNPFDPAWWVPCDISIGAKVTAEQIAHGCRFRRRVTEPLPVETPAAVKPRVDPGEGWKLLALGDTLEEGDQVHAFSSRWVPTKMAGTTIINPELRYRRRTTPAPADDNANWRFMREGEIIVEGDEFEYSEDNWVPAYLSLGERLPGRDVGKYRRQCDPKPNPGRGWRLLETGETVQQGDQYIDWRNAECVGLVVDARVHTYRRLKNS